MEMKRQAIEKGLKAMEEVKRKKERSEKGDEQEKMMTTLVKTEEENT